MTADHASLSQHPAPDRGQVSAFESVFGLLGGPGAWFAQLCAGYSLASWPCFPLEEHRLLPQPGYAWTWGAIVVISIAAIVTSVAAYLVSRRMFSRTRTESHADPQHLLEVGSGRTRFLALWGMVLGASFAVATAMTTIAFFVLPRCAG
jgi:hypothetical protein